MCGPVPGRQPTVTLGSAASGKPGDGINTPGLFPFVFIVGIGIKLKSDVLMANYRALRNKVNRDIKAHQKLYYESQILDNNGNTNGMWKALRHVLNQKKM